MDCFQLEQSSEELRAILVARQDLLEQFLAAYGDRLRGSPEGTIRTSYCKNYVQFYFRKSPTDRWRYLSVKERSRAEEIINRDYWEKLLSQVSGELMDITRFLSYGYPMSIETVLQGFSSGRRSVLPRLSPSDEEVIQEFYSLSYDPLSAFTENKQYETTRGEYVRSKAEWMIAEKLADYDIPYQYEAPLRLKGLGTVRPDFRCLNVKNRKVVYWEHLGKMGDNEYASDALRKLRAYTENGFHVAENLIVTQETGDCPLVPAVVDYWIQRILLT